MVSLKELQRAPEKPGVYLFKMGNKPIYIGKAKNLRDRLVQHYRLAEKEEKESAIVSNATSVEWIVTRNTFEALTLEVDLIQVHKPRYNVLHKYGGGYPLILLTSDPWPTVKVVRGTEHEGSLFGPFFSTSKAKRVKRLLHRLFKLRTCDPLPSRKEPCMDYHLGLCSAPCCNMVDPDSYSLSAKSAVALLSGEVSGVLEELYARMEREMQRLNFERCAMLRDQIQALENLSRGQKVSGLRHRHADLIYLMGRLVGVFLIRSGKLVDKQVVALGREEDLEEFLIGFYYKNPLPETLLVNFQLSEELLWWLTQRKSFHLSTEIGPELEQLLRENMAEGLPPELLAEEFKRVLGIPAPKRIEGFDISHFYGEYTVGSCVVWVLGRMEKRDYRRYRIKSFQGVDDYRALEEVLSRRARRLERGEEEMPDLWLIDGGLGQLSVAVRVRDRFSLPVRVFSLAKAEEILFTEEGKELRLKEHPLLYRVFGLIRDEAHRFALTYNRKLRLKEGLQEVLDRIKGVGEAKKTLIYRNFENLYEFLKAEDDQLKRLGINPALKQEVAKYLQG
ncbi:MAG: excinuclease ABC subunit UvrC [Aquificaceae bacterium]|nr:excinuclease ABC subunit UvrC [Aquificaceae bacterium]MDW8097036.1 excinuclease ABC subunit UvrC [Aquificaceae bacterium]